MLGADVDIDHLRACRAEHGERRFQRRHHRRRDIVIVIGRRHADTQALQRHRRHLGRVVGHRIAARRGILRIGAGNDLQQRRDILRRAAEGADIVERV